MREYLKILAAVLLMQLGCLSLYASGWGLVNVSAASLRSAPAHSAEMETQVPMGTPVRLVEEAGEWLLVDVPDGYRAYIPASAVVAVDSAAMESWKRSPRLILTSVGQQCVVADSAVSGPRNIVSDVTLNAVLQSTGRQGERFVGVRLPDGREGFLPRGTVDDFHSWARREPSAARILDVAFALSGVPYLWGGATTKALDCSGLTQVCYFAAGVLLPRNAGAQALAGEQLPCPGAGGSDSLRQADLLFFDNGSGNGRITHVALFDTGTHFIHASGRVFESSFDPADSLFIPREVIRAVRVLGSGSEVRVASHPWYF